MSNMMSNAGFETVSSALDDAENYNRWIIGRFEPYLANAKRLVEVGVGHANFRPYFPDLIGYMGVDIDADVVEKARLRWSGDRFECFDVCDPEFVRTANGMQADTVLCVSVLQNVEQDAVGFRNVIEAVVPGGHACVFVPGMPFLFGGMDRMSGHFRRYTKASLRAVLPPDVRVVRLEYFNPVGALGWAANNLIGHQSVEDEAIRRQVRLFDTYVVPLSRAIDPLTRGFFGQSLVAVIQRL